MQSECSRFAAGCRAVTVTALLLTLAGPGCRPAAPVGPGPAPEADEPDAPTGEAIADPVLREAREQADAILAGLLAGKFDHDQNLAPVAKKLKGYQSASVKSQQVVRDGAAEFRGILNAPGGRARFDMQLVKQADGTWAIGTFGGPNPE